MQIITGILLAMHYTPHVDLAFASTEHIMRDVNNGWLLRYGHANGASMFFIIVYVHIARGLYYGSYMKPRHHLWGSGVLIFFLMMATGFMGYVLPWGQMSFWGVTVITNLFSAIPVVGPAIVEWLWGGFSVDNPTLNRFFSLHYLLPFIIAAVAGLHLVLLHQHGSNNPLGIDSSSYKISFYPYFYVKDLFSFLCFILFFSVFVYYYPNVLGHPDNYIQADPLKTPPHVVPEWYYLPFYAILRSIPDKLGGVVAMGGAVAMLATLPYVNTGEIRSSVFRPIYRILFWIFVVNVLSLTVIGQIPVKEPFVTIGQVCTLLYFGYFLSLPLIAKLESHLNK
jgi:ubiquinol-cytochrome c reductase cytochrome b subunit